MSQPAVSNAIKHMEIQLGFSLFSRINNRLFPTDEAKVLFKSSDEIFTMHATLRKTIDSMREKKAGTFRVSATPPVAQLILPDAIARANRRDASIRINLSISDAEHVVEDVAAGNSDVGLILDNPSTVHGPLVKELVRSTMVCAIHANSPLAHEPYLSPEKIQGHPLIALARESRFGKAVRETFEKAHVPLEFKVEVGFGNAACVLASAGVGVAIIDSFSAVCGQQDGVLFRPFLPRIEVGAYAIFSEHSASFRLLQRFIEDCREAFIALEIEQRLIAPQQSTI